MPFVSRFYNDATKSILPATPFNNLEIRPIFITYAGEQWPNLKYEGIDKVQYRQKVSLWIQYIHKTRNRHHDSMDTLFCGSMGSDTLHSKYMVSIF